MSFTILAVPKRPGHLTTIKSQFPDQEKWVLLPVYPV